MKKILLLAILITISSCASFTISKESLADQLEKSQSVSKTNNIASLGTAYYSNNLQKIKCLDKNGNEVLLSASKNMNFVVTKTSTGKSVNMYFDTVYIKNDTLFGLKSRIIGGKRMIALNDVSKIIIQKEN